MSTFAQSLRQVQILILEIRNVFLWLTFSSSWTLNKMNALKLPLRVILSLIYSETPNSKYETMQKFKKPQ
jgi:hypothetical protein